MPIRVGGTFKRKDGSLATLQIYDWLFIRKVVSQNQTVTETGVQFGRKFVVHSVWFRTVGYANVDRMSGLGQDRAQSIIICNAIFSNPTSFYFCFRLKTLSHCCKEGDCKRTDCALDYYLTLGSLAFQAIPKAI